LRNYADSEKTLTDAVSSGDADAIESARQNATLAARQAVDLLHYLADYVLKEPSPNLQFMDIVQVRIAVGAKCVFLREAKIPIDDVSLLRDIADAFKHHRPDRRSATVLSSTDIAPFTMGFGQASFGEGKFSGDEQMVIVDKNGDKRALSSVLQNVFDAWTTLLGQPLTPINEY
jgi:hypothetical protein